MPSSSREHEPQARAALAWIDEYANLQGNGYVSYERRNEETGLENQCWKDSWDSISYRDGRLPGYPLATCELQGYAYDAKMRGARLARTVWKDPDYAERLEKQAADLKRRFNRDFWVEDGQYYALALDSRTAARWTRCHRTMVTCYGAGSSTSRRPRPSWEHLMGPQLFSGWGVRTLAEGEGRFNPIGYHTGAVWPFDNSFIAWGLRRYGFKAEAARIAAGILDAADFFEGRLPEAFAGYERRYTKYPVEYPTACSPQAWSTGTPLLLLRTMLGLEPMGEHLVVDPALPARSGTSRCSTFPGRWGAIDAFGRGRVVVDTKTQLRPQLSASGNDADPRSISQRKPIGSRRVTRSNRSRRSRVRPAAVLDDTSCPAARGTRPFRPLRLDATAAWSWWADVRAYEVSTCPGAPLPRSRT